MLRGRTTQPFDDDEAEASDSEKQDCCA